MSTSYYRELESTIAAFERQKKAMPGVCVGDFFPAADHPQFSEMAVELLRVDLEYEWECGSHELVDRYREVYADLLQDPDNLKPLAFEEYRLRRQAGEKVGKQEYEQRFGISTKDWPHWSDSRVRADDGDADIDWVDTSCFPQAGQTLLDFELISELGRGAFSRVFLARQGNLANRFVVLKASSRHWIESDLLARLQHNNIVPIYSVHQPDGLQLVCMPFLGCSTLADVLKRLFHNGETNPPQSGEAFQTTVAMQQAETLTNSIVAGELRNKIDRQLALTATRTSDAWRRENDDYVNTCLAVAAGVAEGLSHAHVAGIVHRDLKPANILLTDDGRPMLLDFNLSYDAQANSPAEPAVGGTLPYMSPEHLRAMQGEGAPDAQSDIYSLGVILFEMLTGRRPFRNHHAEFSTVIQRMIDDRGSDAPAVRPFNHAVPLAVESIVRRCLEPDRQRRYRSAQELCEDLQRQLQHRPLRFAADRSVRERYWKWVHRHPKLMSGLSVAIAASLLIVAIVAGWRMRETRLASIAAQSEFVDFQQAYHFARLALSSPTPHAELVQDGVKVAEEQFDRYGLLADDDYQESPQLRLLPDNDRRVFNRGLAELLFLRAAAAEQATSGLADEGAREAGFREALRLNRLAMQVSQREESRAFLLQRARLFNLLHESETAEQMRRSARDATTQGFFDVYLAGLESAKSGQYDRALNHLTKATEMEPLDYAAWLARGQVWAVLRRFSDAEADFARCVALHPEDSIPFFYRGVARLEAGAFAVAEEDFNRVLEGRIDFSSAFVYRAMAREQLRRYPAAIEDLTQAIQLGCEETRVYFLRSRLRRQMGDSDGAQLDWREGMSRIPADEMSWIERAMAQLSSDPDAAYSDLQAALEINPRSYTALRNASYVLSDLLGRTAEAIELLDRILQAHPNDAEIVAGRGVLSARIGENDAAFRDAERALRLNQDAETLIHVACIYALASRQNPQDAERAVQLVRRGLTLDPSWVDEIVNDADLKSLSSNREFQQVVAAATSLIRGRSDESPTISAEVAR